VILVFFLVPQKKKAKVYEEPYYEICGDLFGRGDAYDVLKNKMTVEFVTTSHLRGLTFRNCIVVADEIQNFSGGECSTLITRAGNDCKLIYCGDFRQSDLKKNEANGFHNFMNIIQKMPSFAFVEFGIEDIVRSGLCKEFLTIQHEMGINFL
jgi:phosphate starvation-inducible PhoH-like protein